MRRAVWTVLLAAAVAAPAAAARPVRVFAVGPKFGLEWVDTRAHFHDHLLGLMDATARGPDVQPEAGDVASHLLAPTDMRNLVTLPEDLGLMAIFSGSRGEQARGASDVTTAIVDVLGAYAPQTAYYATKFPALGQRGIPTRLLALAATDTFARVAVETYAELAAKYHVWLEAGVNMVRDWQVVCQSKATMPTLPGGVTCAQEDPVKVAQLQTTDEPQRTYAYEATSDKASNMALVFDPTGKLVSEQVKTYLTPIELPGQLDLLPGEVFGGLSALHTPVGTLGFVTSKDAWMPDVTARLDQQHVDLLVQPEFFVGDTISTTGPWAPDNIKGAGYSDVLRHPSMEAMVLPELTGNLFDLSADNQQAIVTKPRGPSPPRGFLLGQLPAAGFAVVGDWVVPDPLTPGETIAQRRARLGAAGEQMLPSGATACPTPAARGVCRGGQVEDVIFSDVEVARAPRVHRRERRRLSASPFGVNRPVAVSARAQRNVALAAHGRRAAAVFEERTATGDTIYLTRSRDGGRTWGRRQAVGRGAHRWWPAVSIGADGTTWLAWSDDRTGVQRVYVGNAADRRGTPADASPAEHVQQLHPAIAATSAGAAFVAFVDDRARFAGDDLPQAGIWGVALANGRPGKAARLDSVAKPAALAATLDNAWAPSLAADGRRLELTWTDFRDYEWNAYARGSADGGATWGAERRVNDTPDSDEALEDTARAAWIGSPRTPLVAFTDWAKSARSSRAPSPLYDVAVARPGEALRKVDGTGNAPVEAFAPAITAAGDSAIVAWQDHRHGDGDIYAARVGATRTGRPVRVDDSGRRGWNQWRPALARAGGYLVAAWEDERDGPPQIFFARAPVRRVG